MLNRQSGKHLGIAQDKVRVVKQAVLHARIKASDDVTAVRRWITPRAGSPLSVPSGATPRTAEPRADY